MIKILFIEAVNYRNPFERAFLSLGLGYISAYLKKNSSPVSIKIINHNIHKEIDDFKPNIIGISSVSQNFNIAKDISALCKEKKIFVVAGGCHITSLPASLPDTIDLAVYGEGEETMLEIVNTINEFGFDLDRLRAIRGTFYRSQEGKIIFSSPRDLILPLDNIPFPDRDILGIGNKNVMITSRGCPYRCIFCSSTTLWPKLRYFSAKYVAEEIKVIFTKFNKRYIEIWDDLFIADKARLKQVIDLLKKDGLLGKVEFCFAVRANLINEEMAGLLKEMNVVIATMGLESMSQASLSYLKNNSVTVEENRKAVEILNSYGIKAAASFVIGSPQETESDILQTLNFTRQANLHNVKTYMLTPFPATKIWEYAALKGLVSSDMDWSRLNIEPNYGLKGSIILSQVLSREKLWYLLKKFKRVELNKRIALKLKKVKRIIKLLFKPGKAILLAKSKIKEILVK